MPNTKILALGHYLPPNIVTNEYLASILRLPEEQIRKRTGVEERRYVGSDTSCSDIAFHAVENALQRSGLSQEEIDLIIFATLSPDHFFPGSGCFLQEKLKLPGVPALDIRNQCSGFLYGLAIADHFIRLGTYKRVLIAGAEIHSTGLNLSPEAKDISILFGDGAACAILGPSNDTSQIILSKLHADGRYARELWVEVPSSSGREQIGHEDLERGAHYPKMNGGLVFRHAVKYLSEVVHETLTEAGYTLDDVSLFIFHQANLRIIDAVGRRLRVSQDKVLCNIQKYGNTTSASIPILLSEAQEEGRLERGNLVLLAAFGAGFTWASTLLRY
jgi:3-oxoacyl-[acyl-carrier-protein] synthase-3